jgi:hypothetical protein
VAHVLGVRVQCAADVEAYLGKVKKLIDYLNSRRAKNSAPLEVSLVISATQCLRRSRRILLAGEGQGLCSQLVSVGSLC